MSVKFEILRLMFFSVHSFLVHLFPSDRWMTMSMLLFKPHGVTLASTKIDISHHLLGQRKHSLTPLISSANWVMRPRSAAPVRNTLSWIH